VYCAIVVQYYCNSVGITSGGGNTMMMWLVLKNVSVNEYLVKANSRALRSALDLLQVSVVIDPNDIEMPPHVFLQVSVVIDPNDIEMPPMYSSRCLW